MTRFRLTVTTRGALLFVVLGIGFIFLWTIRPVLPPLIWALVVAYILHPAVSWVARTLRVPRLAVVSAFFAVFLALLVWGFVALRPVLAFETGDLLSSLPGISEGVQDFLFGSAPIEVFGFILDTTALKDELNQAVQQTAASLGRQAIPFVWRAVSSVFHGVFFLLATFYLLLDMPKLGPAFVRSLPRRWGAEVIPLLRKVEHVLGSYIRGQVLLIMIQMVACWIVLTVLQVRYALLLAIVTGAVEIFPVIGPWTAGAIAVSVSLTQPTALFGGNSAMLATAVGISYFVLRQLEDVFVIPNVVGKIMEMHPLVVLFSLTVGAYLAGILGVLIAVPLAAVVKLLLGYLRDKLLEEEQIYLAEKRSRKLLQEDEELA